MLTPPHRIELSFISIVLFSALMLGLMSWQIRSNRNLAKQGRQAHSSLCILKLNLLTELAGNRAFYSQHPESAAQTYSGGEPLDVLIERQQETLDALSGLRCF